MIKHHEKDVTMQKQEEQITKKGEESSDANTTTVTSKLHEFEERLDALTLALDSIKDNLKSKNTEETTKDESEENEEVEEVELDEPKSYELNSGLFGS